MSASPRSPLSTRFVARAGALLCVGILGLSACGQSVSSDEVEEQISTQWESQMGQSPDEVDCTDDLPAEEGESITCVLTTEGESVDLTATVSSVEGDTVNFDIDVSDASE